MTFTDPEQIDHVGDIEVDRVDRVDDRVDKVDKVDNPDGRKPKSVPCRYCQKRFRRVEHAQLVFPFCFLASIQ